MLHPYFQFEEDKIRRVTRKCREEMSQRNLTDGRKRDGLFVPFSMEKIWRSAKSTPPILFPVFRELETYVLLTSRFTRAVFLNRRAAARYRALASIIPDRERPEETTICYKISLVQ